MSDVKGNSLSLTLEEIAMIENASSLEIIQQALKLPIIEFFFYPLLTYILIKHLGYYIYSLLTEANQHEDMYILILCDVLWNIKVSQTH